MPSDNFRIRKISDRDLIECYRAVAKRCGFEKVNVSIPVVRFHLNEVADPNWSDNPTIQQALEMNAMLIQGINFWVGQGVHISFSREANNPLTDAATCKTLGNRRYVGCDIEEKWVKVGIDRLSRMSLPVAEDEDWGSIATKLEDEDWGRPERGCRAGRSHSVRWID